MPAKQHIFTIHSDGSCLKNPGAGGWAVIILDEKNKKTIITGGAPYTTNNRMELEGAIAGIKHTPGNSIVNFGTDSQYVRLGITQWIKSWKKNGWKTAAGKDVQNKELWMDLDNLVRGRNITWNWVRGHSGHELNEECDVLAREQAEKFNR